MNPAGNRPCCELLSNLERENLILGREFIKFRLAEEDFLAKRQKLKQVSSYVHQKLNDLWYSACHMAEGDERRRIITGFVTLTSKAWENDYNKIERDTINDRLTKGDGPLTGLLEKIQCSVTFTEAKFRTSMLWDSACHNKFNSIYNEMVPKLARFSCSYMIQCTATIIDKAVVVFQTIDENIRRFLETLVNFHPSHFSANHSDIVEPQPLAAFSRVTKLLTTDHLLQPPQAHALDLRAQTSHEDAYLDVVTSAPRLLRDDNTMFSASYRYIPRTTETDTKRFLTALQRPAGVPCLTPFHTSHFENSSSTTNLLPYYRGSAYSYPPNSSLYPYLGGSSFYLPNLGLNSLYARRYPTCSAYDSAWEADLRARQAEFYCDPLLRTVENTVKETAPLQEKPAPTGKENNRRQVPVIRRRRRRRQDVDGSPPPVPVPKERRLRKNHTKTDPLDLQPIRVPKLSSDVITPLP